MTVGKEHAQYRISGKKMLKTYDFLFKLVLIGDSGVGKRRILERFSVCASRSTLSSTFGIDFTVKTVKIDNIKIKLQIWNTPGQERYREFREAMGFMLVYDVTYEKSFENIRYCIRRIEENASADVEMMLLGNKCDLEESRVVTKERGQMLAAEHGIKFFEISAKSGLNVEDAFLTLARDIKDKMVAEGGKSSE